MLVRHNIAPVVHSREQIEMLNDLRPDAALDVYVKLNTGMNRLGFEAGALRAAVADLERHPAVKSVTLMTHFASADEARGVEWQMQALERVANGLALPRSLANSAAILRHPETHADWVRPGIMLYASPIFRRGRRGSGSQAGKTLESRGCGAEPETVTPWAMAAFTARRNPGSGCGVRLRDGYPRHAPTAQRQGRGTETRTVGRVSMDAVR